VIYAVRGNIRKEPTIMKKLAICIGINDYPGTGSDLAGCVNNAHDWGEALTARGFSVAHLLDKQATGAAMRAAIKSVIGKAASGDLVVIQYSEHGSFVPDQDGDEPDGTDECRCPYDIEKKGPITDDELSILYPGRAAGVKLVVISDSCHLGTVARFAPITTPATAKGKNPPTRKVRFLPAGCQDSEYSYDAVFEGRPNGAFTFVALRELAKLPKTATYQDWHDRIRKVLPSQQYPQMPNLFGTSAMKEWRVLGEKA
jgi:hypothetical protein